MALGKTAAISDLSPDESEAPFFRPALSQPEGGVVQGAPYLSADSNRWVVANATPIVIDGHAVAFLHFETNLDAVRERVAALLEPGMRARIVDTSTDTLIADTATGSAGHAPQLPEAGAWGTAAGPVRSAETVQVANGNTNRWRV